MDWYRCVAAGARFAFLRAGSCTQATGNAYTDDQFLRNAELAPDYLPCGAYWYFRPNHDPIDQANYFCDLLKASNRFKLPPACDLEEEGGLTPLEVTERTKQFIYQVFHRISQWPLIYSRAAWLNTYIVTDEIWKLVELWVARYTSKPQPWGNPGDNPNVRPRYFSTWRFWQWSADGNGLGGTYGAKSDAIDLDYFNGDEAAFGQYIQGKLVQVVKVKKPAAAIRSGPSGTGASTALRQAQGIGSGSGSLGTVIGTTWRGRTWQAAGKSSDGKWTKVEGWIKTMDLEES
jgi:GH25 family lysozyme M1 (1,4-beta-N-acetylmuramidase)